MKFVIFHQTTTGKKYCSVCNKNYSRSDILEKEFYELWDMDVCHVCNRLLSAIVPPEQNEKISIHKYKSKYVNTERIFMRIFISCIVLLLFSWVPILFSSQTFDGTKFFMFSFFIDIIIIIASGIVWGVSESLQWNYIRKEMFRLLNKERIDLIYYDKNIPSIFGELYYSREGKCFAFLQSIDEKGKSFEIIKIHQDSVICIEPIINPLNYKDLLNRNGLTDMKYTIAGLVTHGISGAIFGSLIDELLSKPEEIINIVCGIKLHIENQDSYFFKYLEKVNVPISETKAILSNQVLSIFTFLSNFEKENIKISGIN